ncbi:MAG: geranylgeranyl reductase family protein [Methanosarcinaceae archaeon]|nr:geranylgeranyl reductase family protein [Methanosarcinaceae archaeon]
MYDVIIVGTGPAGSTAARYVAAAGLDTLILEKKTLPRIKPCGGAVSAYALANLGIEVPNSLIEGKCFGARVWYKKNSKELEINELVSSFISRSRFDAYLTRCAVDMGAELRENVRVRSVNIENDCSIVETTEGKFKCRAVIGADGVHSVCAKNIRTSFSLEDTAFTLEAEIPATNEYISEYISNKAEFHFGVVPNGYGWVFPKDGYFSVGIGSIGAPIPRPLDEYRSFLKNLGFDYVKPRGHFLPIGGMQRKSYANRILLAGDAAGYVDAFLGEGIAYAIISGKIAAETVIDACQKNDFSEKSLAAYQTRCTNAFGSNLKYSHIFSKIFYLYNDMFLKMLLTNEPMLYRFILLPSNHFGYQPFIKWLVPRMPYYLIKNFLGAIKG